jgi:hypothetical protein
MIPGTHSIGGWVGHRTGLVVVANRPNTGQCPEKDSDDDTGSLPQTFRTTLHNTQ